MFGMSSSGGGLFGRPAILIESGALLSLQEQVLLGAFRHQVSPLNLQFFAVSRHYAAVGCV